MQLDVDRRSDLNYEWRKWKERIDWIKNPVIWTFSALAIGIGISHLPNQGAILLLVLGCATIITALCFLFIGWIKLRTLNKKIRRL